jgi:ribonuclease-3
VTDPGAVEARVGHRFADPSLLRRALVHRSYASEIEGEINNERLEFLGDAVLSVVVAEELFRSWDLSEGAMAKVRAAVVNEASLATVAVGIGLGDALLLGKGEEASGGRHKASILADAMEAVLGAVFLDGGLDAARRLILERWGDLLEARADAPGRLDYKTRLQEALARRGEVPEYAVEGEGPDHERSFTAEVQVGGMILGSGSGSSKKRAEQDAARRALDRLRGGA